MGQPMSLQEIGQALKKAREKKNMKLESVSKKTQISLIQLTRLERGEARDLPAPVHVKGFIRAYSQVVSLDAEELLKLFEPAEKESISAVLPQKPSEAGPFRLIHFVLSFAILFFVSLIIFMRALLEKYEDRRAEDRRVEDRGAEDLSQNPLYIEAMEKRMEKHIQTGEKAPSPLDIELEEKALEEIERSDLNKD